jgi:hypothetical protein
MASTNLAVRGRFDTLRSLGFASIGGGYMGIGTAFAHPVKLLKIINLTDANLIVSYDGVNNQDIVTANGGVIYDISANKADPAGTFQLSVGDRVYVMEETSAPTLGNVYVVVVYASEN